MPGHGIERIEFFLVRSSPRTKMNKRPFSTFEYTARFNRRAEARKSGLASVAIGIEPARGAEGRKRPADVRLRRRGSG